MTDLPRVTVWNEYHEERRLPEVARHYPEGIHAVLRAGLLAHGMVQVRTATLEEPGHGLGEAVLEATDVLVWWGHRRHADVDDAVVARVQAAVLSGMGLVVLHSAHMSKIFRALMGTSCTLNWRHDGERERLWVVAPAHPIAAGIDRYFELEQEEMYGEPFGIPTPDEIVFMSWFQGGEVFRSGSTFSRGRGRIFYFQPGHETFPTYHHPLVQLVIANAVRWAAPGDAGRKGWKNAQVPPIEPIS
ncbi:MAG: ThuA domain-containing protein [Acetobacteraceae bacterium]|nr:ThuA domain-containing protein [Acetobacteraceae bacterium]